MEILRFDGNVPPLPLPTSRPAAIASALARVNEYPHGGYPLIHEAIADYAGVEPENVVLGAGADDLIMLVARAFAGPGDTVAIPEPPTYPLFRDRCPACRGATLGDDDPALTFACRPANPTGALDPIPAARPLVVDEAYFEYADDPGAVGLIDDDVVVIRTFSKLFALAGARIGYALASRDVAAELNARQPPAQVSTLSVALALAALAYAARRPPGDRGARAARIRAARTRLRAAAVARELRLRPRRRSGGDRREAARRRLRRAGVRRRDPNLRARPRGRRLSSRNARRGAAPRRQRRARARAHDYGDARFASGSHSTGRAACALRPAPGSTTTSSSSSRSTPASISCSRAAATSRRADHHTAEDAAIALGEAVDRALGDRKGIARYGDAVVPMDDARASAAVDLGGRRHTTIVLEHDPGLAQHVLASFADNARIALHVESTGD